MFYEDLSGAIRMIDSARSLLESVDANSPLNTAPERELLFGLRNDLNRMRLKVIGENHVAALFEKLAG